MKIIDINGNEKNAISLRRFTYVIKDSQGKDVPQEYVEASIIGKYRDEVWIEAYPLEDFKRLNPDIEI